MTVDAQSAAYDAIVIGAGHNGLVCAAYLAQAGRQVVIVEARETIGGASATRQMGHGARVSECAHLIYQLHPKMVRELGLYRHGLKFSHRRIPTVGLAPDGRHITLSENLWASQRSIARHSQPDSEAFGDYLRFLERVAGELTPYLSEEPPALGGADASGRAIALALGRRFAQLGREDGRLLVGTAASPVADFLERFFSSPFLVALLAFDALPGTFGGPRSPGTMIPFLHRRMGEVSGVWNAIGHPEGGVGAVPSVLWQAARQNGAELRVGRRVTRVRVEGGRARGVELDSGEVLEANMVVSSADPKTTLLDLVGPAELDIGLVEELRAFRARGTAAKFNAVLTRLPEISGLAEADMVGRFVIAPSTDYLEAAFNPVKYGEVPEKPAIEFTIPSVHDQTLASEGRHVLSAIAIHAPSGVAAADAHRGRMRERVLEVLEEAMPGLRSSILEDELLMPGDLETRYGLPGGHWHHGELAADQLFFGRPVPRLARYATPVESLYLCGAGSHPGGGVMGAAGRLAARRILKAEGSQ